MGMHVIRDARHPELQTILRVSVPTYYCTDCRFGWTNHVAEEIREGAVRPLRKEQK